MSSPAPHRSRLRRIDPPLPSEAAPPPVPIAALYNEGSQLEQDGFPVAEENRTDGMESLRSVFLNLGQILFKKVEENANTSWVERVLPGDALADARAQLTQQLTRALDDAQDFIVDSAAQVAEFAQQRLTGRQQQAHDELGWYVSEAETSQSARFADAALATLVELMVSLVAPFTPDGSVPPPTGNPLAFADGEAAFLVAHFAQWFGRLLTIANALAGAIQSAQEARAPDAAPLLFDDARGLLAQQRLLSKVTQRLQQGSGAAFAEGQQRKRLSIVWSQQRDAAFQAGLPGAQYMTYENIGAGDCGYASFVAGFGRDGVMPDPTLGWGTGSALHQIVRDRAADYHLGPIAPVARNLTNRQYQACVRTRTNLLLAGELDQFATRMLAWNKHMTQPGNGMEPMTVWKWSGKELSDGPFDGETYADWTARGGYTTEANQMTISPLREAEDANLYTARVDRAYEGWVAASRFSSQSDGIPYWAQEHDWAAIAAVFARRIHIYKIVNSPPGSIHIARFVHHSSYGDPIDRPVCIAWTMGGPDGYRKGNPRMMQQTREAHYAVILRRYEPYAPHVGWAEALLPYPDGDPEPLGPLPTDASEPGSPGIDPDPGAAQREEMERLRRERIAREQAATLEARRLRMQLQNNASGAGGAGPSQPPGNRITPRPPPRRRTAEEIEEDNRWIRERRRRSALRRQARLGR